MLRATFLSAAALSLALVAPAHAQTADAERLDMEQIKEMMGEAGLEARRDFTGTMMRARTKEGETLFMLVSPRDLGANGEIEVSESDLRERFENAGLTDVEVVDQAQFAVGDLDDDKAIIVMRARDVRTDDVRSGSPAPAATGSVPPLPPVREIPGADVPAANPPVSPGLPGTTIPSLPTPVPTTPGAAPTAEPGAGGTIR